jgi:hypothetical protein
MVLKGFGDIFEDNAHSSSAFPHAGVVYKQTLKVQKTL